MTVQKMGKLQLNPYSLSESRYEIIQIDLNRKVGIFEKRGKFYALSDGKQFSSLMILTMTEKVLSIFISTCRSCLFVEVD